MDLNLSGKRAMVCGSTQGIGKATAVQLAKLGASVILVARNDQLLKAGMIELDASNGQRHGYLAADFSQPDQLKMKMDSAMREFDPIHILVNNTGGPPPGPASDATRDAFESAFRQHLICNQILTQAVLPGMKREKYGRIVNIISTSVKQPIPGLGVSNTIRGAVASWAKTLSVELAPFGITVNNVLPGATRTQRLASLIAKKAAESHRTVADVEAEMMEEIPAKRFAEPAEVAHAIAFLASPAAAYINGINVPVDGGRTGSL
jgi:3-oxoacyl-[acyl-carrier protein] reductase